MAAIVVRSAGDANGTGGFSRSLCNRLLQRWDWEGGSENQRAN
ncbi:hypothetical protein RBWH47_05928 [Rhodopirellula baltica WH47]|uniref:Uncharacterized protein n=1 Tax=Rhodopirellula baltica WH47 TaxID=991778 RepID=F2AWA4_RHOBT|nr:hypothetical protein RBWH47_05928 [Rhodopirellula baltica WH47]